MEAQVVNSEFVVLKDTVWKLSSRVLLLEGFIKKQFGSVFWKFCEEQVTAAHSAGSESPHSEEGITEGSEKAFPMSPVIPIYCTVTANTNPPTLAAANSAIAVSNLTVNKNNKPIPPPPPLSSIKNNNVPLSNLGNQIKTESNNSTGGYQYKPRNFLPKSLAPKPKLCNNNFSGGNSNISTASTLKDAIMCGSEDAGATNSSDSSDSIRFVKTELQNPQNVLQQIKSPVLPLSKPNIRLSSGQPLKPSVLAPTRTQLIAGNHYGEMEYYKGESDSDEDPDDYSDGYLAAELVVQPNYLVSATLATPSDSAKRMRYALASSSSSLNGTTPRQMRPNPCHTRCQNRCHDIWTDGDRMGVFETYWSIPTEEERREFVAQRIERVDMATKRTEFSNFRTCTFKYYLPHQDNPWVQVCKNFFLATIDEKRSYIEKIAQSVKGETEKVAAKDIPFRRRNQMHRVPGSMDYVGWMTGMGIGVDQADIDSGDVDDGDGEGMEIMEDLPIPAD